MKPQYAGQGWGSRWLEHMERGFAAMGMERFEMHPTGDAGYGFVAKNGFRKQPGEHLHRTTITLTELWRRPLGAKSGAGSVRSST